MASKRTAKKRATTRIGRDGARSRTNTPSRTRVPVRHAKQKKSVQTRRTNDSICPIVGVGGSAGGYEAASELLSHLAPKSGMAFVIVQHLDPHHASNLPKLLGKTTQMPVVEINGRIKPEPNAVYVLPPNKGLVYQKGALTLTRRIERPTLAIDRFFESLAEEQGSRAIG